MPDITCEEMKSWIEDGEMHPERFPGGYMGRGGWKGWYFLTGLAAGKVTKIDPECQCELIDMLDKMKSKYETETVLPMLSPEERVLVSGMIAQGFSELDSELSDGRIGGDCACDIFKRLSKHGHVNIRAAVAQNNDLPLECKCDILQGMVNDDRNKDYPWTWDVLEKRHRKECVDIYREHDEAEDILAVRKFNFVDIFEKETGRKVEDLKDNPKELSRLLSEHPEALKYFNKMMEDQRRVEDMRRQIEALNRARQHSKS